MKYAIVECVNGNCVIRAEGITALENAKTQYHARCQALWNASDVITGCVMIVDENLNCVEGYNERIYHNAVQSE